MQRIYICKIITGTIKNIYNYEVKKHIYIVAHLFKARIVKPADKAVARERS
jgi:hypothetical protein